MCPVKIQPNSCVLLNYSQTQAQQTGRKILHRHEGEPVLHIANKTVTTFIFQDYHHYTFDDLGFLNSIFLGTLSLFLFFFFFFLRYLRETCLKPWEQNRPNFLSHNSGKRSQKKSPLSNPKSILGSTQANYNTGLNESRFIM